MKKSIGVSLVCMALVLAMAVSSAMASGPAKPKESKPAIVIAGFGTTVPSAVKSITNITDQVKAAFPNTEVRITFTSNIIRSVWKERQAEAKKWLDMGIPKEVLYVKNIIATIGELREDGYNDIIVQSTHMFFMEQSHDLNQYVRAIDSIHTMKERWRPFNNVVMGRPALGQAGDRYDYHADMDEAIKTLAGDAAMAKKEGAMLVYMGHGNEHWSTGIYAEMQKKMREAYPDVQTFIGVVEGHPGLEDFMSHLKYAETKKIILKPFMIVAGDHAVNDMAGPEDDSWKTILTKEGYQAEAVLEGLGSNDQFAQLFVDHIKDAAQERHINLK